MCSRLHVRHRAAEAACSFTQRAVALMHCPGAMLQTIVCCAGATPHSSTTHLRPLHGTALQRSSAPLQPRTSLHSALSTAW